MRSEPSKTYRGEFFDGESAQAHTVVVRCSTTVIVVSEDTNVLATWSYADLLSPDPLLKDRPARITHATAPYARLVVRDPDFIHCILERAPQLSKQAHRMRGMRIVLACMLAALIVAGGAYLLLTYAPRTVAKIMPDPWRNSLGEQVKHLIVQKRKPCTGKEGMDALAALTQKLATHEPDPGQFKVQVYNLSIVNAFALPGGTIVISGKLIDAASGPDGVAGVLAHEMGHVIERDSEAQLVRNLGISFLQQVLLGGGTIGDSVGGLAGLLTLLSYSREAERRADAHASRIMKKAEVDPAGLISFFEFIKKKYGGGGEDDDDGKQLQSLFSTHPGLDERIDRLTALPHWPTSPVMSDTQWAALKQVCSGATTAPDSGTAKDGDKTKKD